MSRQTGLDKAAAMFGMGDTKIGDAEFDEAFAVRTSDPQRLSARLSPSTRRVSPNSTGLPESKSLVLLASVLALFDAWVRSFSRIVIVSPIRCAFTSTNSDCAEAG